jgi:hypothetical protein
MAAFFIRAEKNIDCISTSNTWFIPQDFFKYVDSNQYEDAKNLPEVSKT